MKYAALIFGDDERRSPKAAASKLSSPEPGQIVRSIDGSVYRVASKIAGPDGFVVKLASLSGKPLPTPLNFRPIGFAMARLASWLKYHLAYNRDFTLYVNSHIEKYNADVQRHNADIEKYNEGNPNKRQRVKLEQPLPYPVGKNGQAYDWSGWFQSTLSPLLQVPGGRDSVDNQRIKDEVIHEMLFNTLGERHVLSQFAEKAKELGVTKENAATRLKDFLVSTFMYRRAEMQKKINERNPEEELSIWQEGDEGEEGEQNILDQFGVEETEFQSTEAQRDIAKFRAGFYRWLQKSSAAGQKGADAFIVLFDLFWETLQRESEADIKRGDLEKQWMEQTGLSFGSFKDYFSRLPDMVEQYITQSGTELGDKNIFIDLMNTIRADREKRLQSEKEEAHKQRDKQRDKERREREKARPAVVSSLNTAGVEGDFAEAISNSENPDVVDPDIQQPTESAEKFAFGPGFVTQEDYRKEEIIKKLEALGARPQFLTEWIGMRSGQLQELLDEVEAQNAQQQEMEDAGMGHLGSVSKTAQHIERGDQLTPDKLKQVKDAFILRWTSDNARRVESYLRVMDGECPKCDIRNPYVNPSSAEGHPHPTIPLQTDEQWLTEHAFYFTNAGKLLPRRHALPAYLAPKEPILASVALRFAVEKAAYNPGMAEYIYQADVFCEQCAKNIKYRLDKAGYAPENPGDESSYDSDKYPKGPYYDQESDSPQHCAKCGRFLENPLTTEGYQYLNQMILEAEEQGRGEDPIIMEWKEFYPERESDEYVAGGAVNDALMQVEQDTDRDFLRSMNTSSLKKAMIPHEFNDADGQAIRNETMPDTGRMPHVYDSTETTQRRVADEEGEDRMAVAKTILEQLGGNKFIAMTGARHFVGGQNNLTFRLPGSGGFTKGGINAVKIELTPNDVYKVTYMRIRGTKMVVVSTHDDIYAENLRGNFEHVTGLYTSLGTMGKSGAGSNSGDDDPRGVGTLYPEVFYEHRTEGISTDGMLDAMKDAALMEQWKCEDCGNIGDLDPVGGGCAACGSQAIGPVLEENDPALHQEKHTPFRETSPERFQENLDALRERQNFENPKLLGTSKPKPVQFVPPRQRAIASDKTADTVPAQEQNAFMPEVPGKSQPMAVPDAIDQTAGPHSPNAPSTAPRTPSLQPRIVNVPAGTEGEAQMKESSADDETLECPKCFGSNVDVDMIGNEGYKIYCEDCEETTYEGRLVPGNPVRDYREMPGDQPFHANEWEDVERHEEEMGVPDMEPEEPPFEMEAAVDEVPDKYWEVWSQEQKEAWLVQRGWVKDDSWHGATWWMQKPMWSKTDHEEDIPYTDTDDAINEELELQYKEEERAKNPPKQPKWWTDQQEKQSSEECRECGEALNNAEGELCGRCQAEGAEDHKEAGDYVSRESAAKRIAWDCVQNFMNDGGKVGDTEALLAYAKANYREMPELEAELRNWYKRAAAAPAPAAPVHPNVQQNLNIQRPAPAPGTPGTMVGIMPGGGGEEEQQQPERRTVEPELMNAKYYMSGSLVAAEEKRLAKEAGLED